MTTSPRILLCKAILKMDIERVKFLLRKKLELNYLTPDGQTILNIAAGVGCLKIVKLLIGYGANINKKTRYGSTPIYTAARCGRVKVVKYLIESKVNTDSDDGPDFLPINIAISKGHINIVKLLLKVSKPCPGSNGLPPLHYAIKESQTNVAKLLISHDEDIHVVAHGVTPLCLAAGTDDISLMELLLKRGASINQKAKYGCTPLHVATGNGRIEAANFLIKKNADVNIGNSVHRIPLHDVASNGGLEMLMILINADSDVNKKDISGNTPFHCALWDEQLVTAFMYTDVDIDAADINGKRARQMTKKEKILNILNTPKPLWSTSNHSKYPKSMKYKVKVMLMLAGRNCQIGRLPKDVNYIVIQYMIKNLCDPK